MKWKDDKAVFEESTLSLELEDELFNNTQIMHESTSDTIRLSDLTASPRGCSCFRIPHWHIPKPRFTQRTQPSTEECSFNHVTHGHVATIPNNVADVNKACTEVRIEGLGSIRSSLPKIKIPEPLATGKTKCRLHLQLSRICPPIKNIPHPQNGKRIKRFCKLCIWSFIALLTVSFSISSLIECGTRIYVSRMTQNGTQLDLVKPPSFVTQFATAWLLVIYPAYLTLNLVFHFEPNTSPDMFINHVMILASDQPTVTKVLTRCILLSVLWQIFLHCLLRSLEMVSSIDSAAILAVLPCINYLFCWIIVHRRFCALRVIAFIIGSSGVILNIYCDQDLMWHKCLCSISVVAFSLYNVVLKRIMNRPAYGQFSAFYFGFSLFNLSVYWISVLFTSIISSAEPIDWQSIPWKHFTGVGLSLLMFILSLDLSNRKVTRAIRSIEPIFAPALCIVFEMVWQSKELYFSNIRIASLVLITLACFLNAIPNRWLKATTKLVQRNHSPKANMQSSKRSFSGKTSTVCKSASNACGNQRVSLISTHGSIVTGSLGLGQTALQQTSPTSAATLNSTSTVTVASKLAGTNIATGSSSGAAKTRSRLGSVLLRAAAATQQSATE